MAPSGLWASPPYLPPLEQQGCSQEPAAKPAQRPRFPSELPLEAQSALADEPEAQPSQAAWPTAAPWEAAGRRSIAAEEAQAMRQAALKALQAPPSHSPRPWSPTAAPGPYKSWGTALKSHRASARDRNPPA